MTKTPEEMAREYAATVGASEREAVHAAFLAGFSASRVGWREEWDRTGYELQGPEVCAIADAIRDGRPYIDDGTFMEAARDALNRLAKSGLIIVPAPPLPGDGT
jgi:hypothetical protein